MEPTVITVLGGILPLFMQVEITAKFVYIKKINTISSQESV
jgi:hypothetical protein